ncbi:MAG: murein biosynthesis integral membrane protein MurJ, partial [Propionibacteriaceae bacterium]
MTDQRVTARDEGSTNSQLISASVLMATGTMASRVLGFLRVILIAFVLDTGTRQAEMFSFANTIPNSIYILFAGGALNTVLVPQIVRAVKHDEDRGEAYTNRIMTAFLLIVGVVTVIVTLAAPLIIRLYTDGQWREPALSAQYDSMVTLAYLCLPQVFFYGAFFLAGQVLNARGRFGPMMWAPVVNNLVSIAVFAVYLGIWGVGDTGAAFTTQQELVLGLGATVGIAAQAAILVPYLRAAGFHYRPRFDLRHTGLGHTFHLAKWTLGFVLVTQAALVVVNRLASRASVGGSGGGLTVYNNAYLLWVLPHSLITISLATAMLPSASRLAAGGDLAGVRDESVRTMRLAVTVLLPAAVAFLALAIPIADALFHWDAESTDWTYTAWALMGFAVGLVPFTLHYICLRTFYALEDTRSTFFLQCIIAIANAGLAVVLVLAIQRPSLVAAALALAYSLSYGLGVVLAFRWLGRKLPGLSAVPVLRHCLRVFLAVLPGGIAAGAIAFGFRQWSVSKPAVVLSLVVAAVVAVGLFLLFARLLRITEVNQIVATVTRRKPPEDRESPGTGDSGAPGPGSSPTIEGAGETAGTAAMGIPTMGEQGETDEVPAQTGA